MAVTYKDIDLLTQKATIAGTEKIPVSDTEYVTTTQIASLNGVGTLNTTNTTAQTTSSSESLGGTVNLHKVAKTGTYSDLIGTPTIPTVPTISTNIATDATSDTKTASPKAVKTYVDDICGDIESLLAAL